MWTSPMPSGNTSYEGAELQESSRLKLLVLSWKLNSVADVFRSSSHIAMVVWRGLPELRSGCGAWPRPHTQSLVSATHVCHPDFLLAMILMVPLPLCCSGNGQEAAASACQQQARPPRPSLRLQVQSGGAGLAVEGPARGPGWRPPAGDARILS